MENKMKEIIKKVPIPLCGVMLGTAALGNLLQSYSWGIRCVCGAIAGSLLIFVLLKLTLFSQIVKEEMKNPVMASVAGTFPMSLMLLSVYVKPLIGVAAYYVWLLAIGLHIALIIYFTIRFMAKLQMRKVLASYYIVYVGIAAAAITAPAYEKPLVGRVALWFGFASLIILFVLITIRYVKFKEVPDPAKPLICIYAAPMSLCLAGYVQSAIPKSYGMLMGMLIVTSVLYIYALVKAAGYLKLPFFPSYAAFTFPFVISAIASKQTMTYLTSIGRTVPALRYVVLAETIIAVLFVVYTLIRFFQFLFTKK